MVTGVDGDVLGSSEGGKPGAGFDLGGVLNYLCARCARSARVLHGGFDVLDEGSATPDIERLRAVTDGEDGLAHVVRVLKKKLVDVVTRGIRRSGLGMRRLAVLLRINVGGRAGEENAITGLGKLRRFHVGEIERDDDGLTACGGNGFYIVRQSAR